MVEDTHIAAISISMRRWLCGLYNDLHSVGYCGFLLQVERLKNLRKSTLTTALVQAMDAVVRDIKRMIHNSISKLLECGPK